MSVGVPLIGHGGSFNLMVSGTPAPINGLLSVDYGSNKVDTPETTNMGSSGTARTFIPGLENSGDVTVKFNRLPTDTSQAALIAAKGSVQSFQHIEEGELSTQSFSGIITSFTKSAPDDKLQTCTFKIQLTGPVTFN